MRVVILDACMYVYGGARDRDRDRDRETDRERERERERAREGERGSVRMFE